mmetsp:Transcript_25558/g.63341  ORF Transcript_25558/g.63341 Transcript_25558/m.63341 type:complete len:133 (-) Transcript_25558:213-611(-)
MGEDSVAAGHWLWAGIQDFGLCGDRHTAYIYIKPDASSRLHLTHEMLVDTDTHVSSGGGDEQSGPALSLIALTRMARASIAEQIARCENILECWYCGPRPRRAYRVPSAAASVSHKKKRKHEGGFKRSMDGQ